jgi:hypothetical protein
MTPNAPALSSLSVVAAIVLLSVAVTTKASANKSATPAADGKSRICLVLPRAQLGQGSSGEDVGEPVRQTLLAYLNGPTADLLSLDARIPVQIEAEAQEKSCEYVLYTAVAQKKGGGFGRFLTQAAPIAGMLIPGVGGMTGNYGAMMAGQAVAQAAATAASQNAQQEAMDALNGASEKNIKKGDQVTLEYQLLKTGQTEPFASKSAEAKASENGEDLLSPLIEQAAIDVLSAVQNLTAAE